MTTRPLRLPLCTLVALAALALSAPAVAANDEGNTAPQPRTVHAPKPLRLGTVDPAALPPAGDGTAADGGQRIKNVFPDPADIPRGSGERIDWPDAGGPVTLVSEDAAADGITAFPAIDVRFDGPYHGAVTPPDPVMAAGRHDVVSLINQRIAMYDRDGTLLSGPTALRTFFGVPSGFSTFDPLALYDPWSDRFIVTCMSRQNSTQDARIYIAFSQTNEADGLWNKYFIDADRDQAGNWADYSSIGVDRNGVYVTANMFSYSDAFRNVTLFIYDKEDGYAGRALDNTHLIDVRTATGGAPFRLRPAYVTEVVPGDEYYLAQADSAFGDRLNLLRLTGDRFTSPTVAAEAVILPGLYFPPGGGSQPGGGGVSTLGASLWNAFYRSGRIWAAQAISGTTTNIAWVHRVDVSQSPAVREETFEVEDATNDTYFPHVIPDVEDNDFAMLSAWSGPSTYVTGRYWNIGADGTVRHTELLTSGQLNNNSQRHGDYFAMGIDPDDSNRIWMIAQYMKNSTFAGNQKIASVLFEDEAPPPPPPPVPDGAGVGGTPVLVDKAGGGDVTVTWDAASCPPADNHLLWYDLAGMAGYAVADETCMVGTSGSWTGAPPAGTVGVIVVSDDGVAAEGSHGVDSDGLERPSASAACGFTQKNTSGTCP